MSIGYNPFDEDFTIEEFIEYRTMAYSLREENLRLKKQMAEQKAEIERLTSLYDGKSGFMTSSIGDLPLTVEGLRKAVDEISRLLIVQGELQDLNVEYYNDAKDLRRENAEQKAEIERLTEENKRLSLKVWNYEKPITAPINYAGMVHCSIADCYKENDELRTKNTELQKQVDELKVKRENVQKILYELGKCGNDKERYTVWVKLIKEYDVEVE